MLFQIVAVGVDWELYVDPTNPFMISACSFNIVVNLLLVILMLRTERRTVRNKRPFVEQEYPDTPKQQ